MSQPALEQPAPAAAPGRAGRIAAMAGRGMAAVLRRMLRALWWAVRSVGVVLLAVAVLAGAGSAVLMWRLHQGPLDVTTPVRWAADYLNVPVRLDTLTVQWAPGPERGLLLRALGLQAPGADVAEAEAELPLAPLLHGVVAPARLQAEGVRVQPAAGAGTGDGPDMQAVLRALRRPRGTGMEALQRLHTVQLRDVSGTFDDPRLGLVTVAGNADLRRAATGGVTGTAAIRVGAGGIEAAVDIRAEADEGGTRVQASAADLQTAALQRLLPQGPVGVDGALSLQVDAQLTEALQPRRVAVRARLGSAQVQLPGQAVSADSAALDGAAEWDGGPLPARATLDRLVLTLAAPGGGWPTTVSANGQATRSGGRVSAEASASVDHMHLADLGKVWPEAWGGNARPWLVENLSAGMVRDGAASVALDVREDGTDMQVRRFTALLSGEDVAINWLRPVPPVEKAQVRLTMAGLDTMLIAVSSARQGPMTLANGVVKIGGLSQKDQDLSIAADVAGAAPDILALLKHPRLKLADKIPRITNPGGAVSGKLTVTLPLESNLQFEQVSINFAGRAQNLRLGNLAAKRDFDRGDVQAEVSQDGLKASGTGTLGGVPGQFTAELDFRNGGPDQVAERIKANGRATPRQLAAAGLDPGDVWDGGTAAYEVEYAGRRNRTATVAVRADLRAAQLRIASWRKAPGAAADASVTVLLAGGDLQGLDNLRARGPGLDLSGRAEMVGDVPALLVLDRIVLGPTRAAGQVQLPVEKGEPVRLNLSGAVLDISDEVSSAGGGGGAGTPVVADVRFDKVLVSEGRSLSGVSGHVEYDGKSLRVVRVQSTGPERLQAVIAPEGRTRRVSVRAADAGLVLQAFDLTSSVRGGALALEARYNDALPGSPMEGVLDITDFGVTDGAAIGKLLQAITVYGIVEALSGPGVAFGRLYMPFKWHREVLELGEVQAFGASLGITARGRLDVGRKRAEVAGTVVPAYALNSALGRLPLVGRLFSAERGGGLVAMEYTVRGPLSDPQIAVNPLSAVTPGVLRRLFRVFE